MNYVVVALGLITLWRLPTLRGTAQQRAGALLLLFLTLSTATLDLGVRRVVDTASGIPDLAILLGHVFALLTVVTAVEFVAAVTDADQRRRALLRRGEVVIAAAMTCMVALFVVIPRRHDRPDFGGWLGAEVTVVGYQMLFQTCVGVGLCTGLVFLVRHWRAATPGPLRTALLLLWLGAALSITYVVSRMWTVLKQWAGLTTPIDGAVYNVGTALLLRVALLLTVVSALIRLTYRVGSYARRHLAYHRLRGLWTTLTEAVPGTVLTPPPHPLTALFTGRSLELLLYRRTVEIRDAQLELISQVPPGTREAAEREVVEGDELALDACLLHVALLGENRGSAHPGAPSWSKAGDLDGEVSSLLELSALMRDPTIISAARDAATSVEQTPAG